MISKTYVAILDKIFDQELVRTAVNSWIERFESVEQVVPESGSGNYTLSIGKPEDIMWEDHLQFRVNHAGDFAWVYLTLGRVAIETSSMPAAEISLSLEVLLNIPHVREIVDGVNEQRLEELERAGLL